MLPELARIGDISAIRRQAEALMQRDARFSTLATELIQLAKGFHIDKIRVLLASFEGGDL